MTNLKELQKLISYFGLPTREAEVYTMLFTKKDFTASEIQSLVNIPRTKIYEVLSILINKGLCTEKKIGRFKKYEVINPKYAMEKLLLKSKEELVEKEDITKKILNIILPMYEKRKGEDSPLDYIEIVKDKEKVRQRWLEIDTKVENEVLIFTKPPFASSFEESKAEEKKLRLKNNKRSLLKVKDILEYKGITSSSGKEEFERMVKYFINKGEEVRIAKELPMKLAIFDDKITMLSLNDPISLKESITTIIVHHPVYAKAHKLIFESIWKEAMTFEEFKIKSKEFTFS